MLEAASAAGCCCLAPLLQPCQRLAAALYCTRQRVSRFPCRLQQLQQAVSVQAACFPSALMAAPARLQALKAWGATLLHLAAQADRSAPALRARRSARLPVALLEQRVQGQRGQGQLVQLQPPHRQLCAPQWSACVPSRSLS